MDRIKYFVWGCLLAFLYVGCVDEDFIEADRGEIRVTGTLANADTRIVYAEHETAVSSVWKARDAIGLSSSKQSNLKYVALSEGTETDFVASSADSLLQAGEGEEVYAYYPFTTLHTKYEVFGEDNSTVSLPELYFQYRSKGLGCYDFIYAVGKQVNNTCSLQFKHLFTFLKLEVKAGLIKEPGEWGQGWQYRGLMIKSSEPLHYIVQYSDPVSPFTPTPKFSVAQQKMFVEKYKDGDGWRDAYVSNDIFYIMDEDSIPADSVITCYIAMLPQSEKAYVRVYDMATEQCLFEGKPVPKGGLKSGCMYSLSLDTLDTNQLEKTQREALIAFYKATGGDNWVRNDNWCSDRPLGEWYGLYVSGNNDAQLPPGYVKDLFLPNNNLKGCIPEDISRLTGLCGIELGDDGYGGVAKNQLTGELPQCMTKLWRLMDLGLKDNKLSGAVPDFASSCPSLRSLDLQGNSFTGALPEYGNGMTFFHMDGNQFTGTIPASHARALTDNCRYGVIANNLTGDIPEEIVRHPNFYGFWDDMLPQNPGYGFNDVDIAAPPVTLPCYDGTQIRLADEYAKNEYTMVFLWDPNCGYSISSMGTVVALYKKYKEKGLEVIAATGNKINENYAEPYFKQMSGIRQAWTYDENTSWIGDNYFLFELTSTPSFYVINKEGNIVYHNLYQGFNVGKMPYQHPDWMDVFDFVANLFGDPVFVPDENDFYTSSDYSRDGEVVTLQTASQGQGIDLVFMGEAFVDKDMGDGGLYEQKMKEAMEQYFSIEPYKSFRNRFNVYAVKVVSPNAEFATGAKHRINESPEVCFEYVQKVTQRNSAQVPMVSVIYNSLNAGRSYTVMFSDGTFVGYMMEGVNNVLNHEVGGHGFAKLLDEYVEGGNETLTLPQTGREELDNVWQNWGWGSNVDWRNDYSTVKWAHFLQDSRYAGEGLGLYEGAYLYGFGAYRPTENSMMRYNDSPFNAPSREQIYKTIMQMSEGNGWTYSYEDFVQYDAINRNGAVTRGLQQQPSAQQVEKWRKTHRPPVRVNGTWRDAVRKNKQILVPLR